LFNGDGDVTEEGIVLDAKVRIGGSLRESQQVETIKNPFDGSVVGTVHLATLEDVDDAITAATAAFPVMRAMPVHERARILNRVATMLDERLDRYAELMSKECGKPIVACRGEVRRAVITFRLGAAEAQRMGGEVMPIDIEARAEGRLCFFQRVPRGPVAAISPFNFPLNLIAHKLSPAFAVGATVVLKPPPQCPLSGHALGDLFAEAGLPAGALSVLACAPDVAQRLVEDERLKVLSFTGSAAVGWHLKSLAGRKQVLLELGGNAPCIVDEGADLDAALPAIVAGAWAYSGQVCVKVQRLLVHRSLYEGFVERFVDATRALKVGDPSDEATTVGPLIDAGQVKRVLSWIHEATEAGANLRCGGEAEGNCISPAVFTDVPADAKIWREEVFGPVTVVEPFGDFDDAIRAANETRYGLQAGVFTPSIAHAMKAIRELDYGGVLINDVPTFRMDNFPYGGVKDSGIGREGVRFAMEDMTEPKVAVIHGL
jgi:acyl-CoA reductase-like NAD-dependent aldehyde dehydrogenase